MVKGSSEIHVRDYADAKIGCVRAAFHLLCNYMPRELPGSGTKGPWMPTDLSGRVKRPDKQKIGLRFVDHKIY